MDERIQNFVDNATYELLREMYKHLIIMNKPDFDEFLSFIRRVINEK